MSEGRRRAILIGSCKFLPNETSLPTLRCPREDVEGLAEALTSPEFGLFADPLIFINQEHHTVLREINRVFRQASRQDQILIYYSGHGKQDDAGHLHLATVDTEPDVLETTSIPVETFRRLIDNNACKQVALILDCCFSGLVGKDFLKGSVDDQLHLMSQGRGIYILTASTATQTAREKEGDRYSLLTKHILNGIRQGEADHDSDGLVSMDDLYEYVRIHVPQEAPQHPMKWALGVQGNELIIARSNKSPGRQKQKLIEYVIEIGDSLPDEILAKATRAVRKHLAPFYDLVDKLYCQHLQIEEFIDEWYRIELIEQQPQIVLLPKQPNLQQSTPSKSNIEDDDTENGEFAMEDFAKILAEHEQSHRSEISENEVVKGRVVKITDHAVIIDVGFMAEGIVPIAEFKDGGQLTIQPGDEIDVYVKQLENADGYVELSRADAVRMQTWDQIEQAYKQGINIIGRVTDRIKGGLRVDIGGIQAFLPGSQVDIRPIHNLDFFRNKEIEVRVLKVNKKRGNIVLSRKIVLEELGKGRKDLTLRNIEEGIIIEGQISNITEYGAFVDIGGLDGLLHITDMTWGRIQNPSELFKVGETIQAKVLKFDRDNERVSLGYKQLIPDPWATVLERYPIGSRVQGKVVSIADYGAFLELEWGVEGLVHVSEMTWSKRVKHPSKVFSVGQKVEALVLEVDQTNRRISLGIKQLEPNPWESVQDRYGIGTRVKGRVRNLTEFGAFIEMEDGIDGLVHVSDISWTKRLKHPSEALKKDQEVEAVITAIDFENHRISLSIKDLEPNAWDQFFHTYRLGDVVTGKISRFANFGAFVELENGVEGLCHVSELSDRNVDKPEDAVNHGQTLQFKILKMDREARKIGLSARAVGKDEPIIDTRN